MPIRDEDPGVAFNLASVLRDEAECIDKLSRRKKDLEITPSDPDGDSPAHRIPDRLGVSFSGGGIRSACVNLGTLQELARINILPQVHYISAVSGGGYILGWFAAWTRRAGFKQVNDQLASGRKDRPPETIGDSAAYSRFLEPSPIRFLRGYAAYLTPRKGILSGDTLAAIAIYLRNLLLNQVLLFSAAIVLLAVLQLFSPKLLWTAAAYHLAVSTWFAGILLVIGAIGVFAGSIRALWCIQKCQRPRETRWQGVIAIAGGVIAAIGLWMLMPGLCVRFHETTKWPLIAGAILGGVSQLVVGVLYSRIPKTEEVVLPVDGDSAKWYAWAISTFCSVVFLMLCFHWMRAWLIWTGSVYVGDSYAVLGLPAWLVVIALTSFLQIGMLGDGFPDAQREWLGRLVGYYFLAACCAALLLLIGLRGPLFMQYLFFHAKSQSTLAAVLKWILPGGWLFTVIAGLLSARSGKTGGAGPQSPLLEVLASIAPPIFLIGLLVLLSWGTHALVMHWEPSEYLSVLKLNAPMAAPSVSADAAKSASNESKRTVLPVKASYGPVAGPTRKPGHSATASGAGRPHRRGWLRKPTPKLSDLWHKSRDKCADLWHGTSAGFLLLKVIAICCGMVGLLGWRLDANEFSLHLFYRSRLVRAFLGASNAESIDRECDRRPSPFTRLAFDDDMALEKLRPRDRNASLPTCKDNYDGPYPIWCGTINLIKDTPLAAQQRKGDSFIYSPLYCGWDYVGESPNELEEPLAQKFAGNGATTKFAYRRSYAWCDDACVDIAPYGGDGGKTYIGTAMAACGAAVSPDSGSHTKPSVAALLAIFNVRIGCWMGNPRHKKGWRKYAPSSVYLLNELCGFADDESEYVYISDGGQFENLAVYELIRRRVKFIIACDADADPNYEFGDLGIAVEKCRRDFGVEITMFDVSRIPPQEDKKQDNVHYAVGTIKYPERCKGDPQTEGLLLYIKNSLTGDEPSDIFSAKKVDGEFPHDSTMNQFFNETQFEAYRALGQHMLHAVWSDCCEQMHSDPAADVTSTDPMMQVQKLYSFLHGKIDPASVK